MLASHVAKARSVSSRPTWSQTLARMTGARRWRVPTFKKDLSPNRVLALRLDCQTLEQRRKHAGDFTYMIRQPSERLPIVTLYRLLQYQDLSREDRLSECMAKANPAEWQDAINSLSTRGYTSADIDRWVWILSGENGDVRASRLTSSRAPLFLLMLTIRFTETFREASSLANLIRHARVHLPTSAHSGDSLENKSRISGAHMFLSLLARLVVHVQRLWPRGIIHLAGLTESFITKALPEKSRDSRVYEDRCLVFNRAISLFQRPALMHPVLNREHNWQAQKHLLAMSERLEQPLVINRESYRAIRAVHLGLPLSRRERWTAARYSKSWPPYRQDFDGMDAKRALEDDHSRSVRAGSQMQEAGYTSDAYDRALDTMGGMVEGSATIQTRGLAPRARGGKSKALNIYSQWAMAVRATRNRQEAWRAFCRFGARIEKPPDAQVYNEMFIKLQADEADPESEKLPGEGRENFPVLDTNLTELEQARRAPPSLTELYDQMINSGIKPRGYCLTNLVRNAGSLEEGLRYLEDSGVDPETISSLAGFRTPAFTALARIPQMAFGSYVQLLCRLQPDRQIEVKFREPELVRIRYAISLVRVRQSPQTTGGRIFRYPWHAILRALARPQVAIRNGREMDNDLQALMLAKKVWTVAERTIGLDSEMLMYFGRSIQKAAVSHIKQIPEPRLVAPGEGDALLPSSTELQDLVKAAFARLTKPALAITFPGPDSTRADDPLQRVPELSHDVNPALLHSHMRTLACLEDIDGMLALARWTLQHYRSHVLPDAEQLRGRRGHAMVAKTLCAFSAFAWPNLRAEEQREMADVMAPLAPLRWPTAEEVDDYVDADRGESRKLRARLWTRGRDRNRPWTGKPAHLKVRQRDGATVRYTAALDFAGKKESRT
ncbi:hypothetical protein GGR56DRAFT_645491 [Xylariaceae sp. FL0804]|nr:hypothetical protein GGR56DRAFT_645491 [Xylariaceae sp. FL0804]